MPTTPFRPEPEFAHGRAQRTAILYCNLGTPAAPTAAAVRPYLAQFLSDRRVVEIPRLLWLPLLHGVILRTRPARSAAKYASIWTPEGSPLRVWTDKQATMLQGWLANRGQDVPVLAAMTYGEPSIPKQLDQLRALGATRILVLPAYPQYSGTTTASVFDAVATWARGARHVPEFRFVNRYHDHPAYIAALAAGVRRHWKDHGRPDRLVMSFHGVPARTLELGDPYHCECMKTARLLTESLGLARDAVAVSFQSRLGRAKWLQPYTEPTLIALARAGVGRVDVICPGFTGDCLETLEEIAMEGRDAFLGAGGREFHALPCLNDRREWIDALCTIATEHMAGWNTAAAPDPALLAASRERAIAQGAAR
jgi:protoporphyrin/coproporphyrin ferrochelatase